MDPDISLGAKEVKTHYVPLGLSFFHPCGLGIGLRATYVDQNGLFDRRMNAFVFETGEDNFWVVDAAISYRLPKRYGFITVGVTNLFDKEFNYYSADRDNPRIQPDRVFFAKVTLAFP
jgi:outer membrane receptor protein involved in Fe transport